MFLFVGDYFFETYHSGFMSIYVNKRYKIVFSNFIYV